MTTLRSHHHDLVQNIFMVPEGSLVSQFPPPSSWEPLIGLASVGLLFWAFYINAVL